MAKAIRIGYKDLFSVYRDAHRKDREALFAFFMSKTGKSKRTVTYMVNTFANLCQLADFDKQSVSIPADTPKIKLPEIVQMKPKPEKALLSEIHINIQLHLPPTNDSTVYDNLFKSLRKNLLSDEEE